MKKFILSALALFLTTGLMASETLPQNFETPTREEVRDFLNGIDLNEVEKLLKGDGAVGWIHGAVAEYRQYVFTFRDPNNFFKFVNLSLSVRSPKLLKQLESLGRHDLVKIKGEFSTSNPSPQKHIKVKSIEVLKEFDPGMPFPKYAHDAKLPEELKSQSELVGKVHAVVAGGRIFVIEYKDAIVPLYVENPEFTQDLYRNDIIRLHYKVQEFPRLPIHLSLDTSVKEPVEVLDSMVAWHDTKGSLEGNLVLFPKSPQLKFAVFALQIKDANGVKRNFTLVNFNDVDVFMAILNKLGKVWEENKGSGIINGRNKLVNLNIKIRATGTFNVVDPNQANPQILLSAESDIEILK